MPFDGADAFQSLGAIAAVVPSIPVERTGARFDVVGMLTSTAGLLALVDAVIEAPGRGWLAPHTLAELAAAAIALAGFVTWERRTAHPMIDVRIFAHRGFSAASGALTVTFFALFGSLFVLTQYLQLVHGYSTLAAGVRALPFALAMGIVSPISSLLAARLGVRAVIPSGLLLMAGGLWWLGAVSATTGYPHLAVAVVAMGAGMGLLMAPASESIMATLPQHQAGAGSAVNDTVREVGGALGVAVIGSLVSAAYRAHLHLTGLSAGATHAAQSSIAAADQIAANAGAHHAAIAASAHQAFSTAMTHGLWAAVIVAIAGAAGAAWALPARSHASVEQINTSVQHVRQPEPEPLAA